jgi:hypothetical protein
MEEKQSVSWSRIDIGIGATATCYAIVNELCVFVPFIPGMATLVSWGLLLPALFIAGSWAAAVRQRKVMKDWWSVAMMATAAYLLMGFFTVYIIFQMWTAV